MADASDDEYDPPPTVCAALARSARGGVIGRALCRLHDPTLAMGQVEVHPAPCAAHPPPALRLLAAATSAATVAAPAAATEPTRTETSAVDSATDTPAAAACAGATAATEPAQGAPVDLSSAADLERLVAMCHPAPFGLGSETVVDESVRRTLELDAEACRVEWGSVLETEVLPAIQQQLSLHHLQLHASLHKVLVYRVGDFFKPHRDNLKAPNHHLTLVVDLGAAHEGGEIEFFDPVGLRKRRFRETSHRPGRWGSSRPTETKEDPAGDAFATFESAHTGGSGGRWAAWFTTQWHAVLPLRQGTRVVAMYNILASPAPARDITDLQSATSAPIPASSTRSVSTSSDGAAAVPAGPQLDLLPPELVLHIAEFLDLRAAAALAATCRWLQSIFPPARLLACGIRAEMAEALGTAMGWRGLDRLGFLLAHPYAMEADDRAAAPPVHPSIVGGGGREQLLRVQPWRLHGRDRVLYDALAMLGYEVELPSGLVVVEQVNEPRYGMCMPSSVNVARAVSNIPMDELLGRDIMHVSRSMWWEPAEVLEEIGSSPTLPLGAEARAVFASAGDPITKLDKRDAPRLTNLFVVDNDDRVKATYIPFRGVFWAHNNEDQRVFAAHLSTDPEFELQNLWGNEGVFDILAYKTAVCLATPVPPVPRMWPRRLLAVPLYGRSYEGSSMASLDDVLAKLLGEFNLAE